MSRGPGEAVRSTALQEKVLWGDLADVFHLIVAFSDRAGASLPPDAARARDAIAAHGFGAITLAMAEGASHFSARRSRT